VVKLKSSLKKNVTTARVTSGKVEFISDDVTVLVFILYIAGAGPGRRTRGAPPLKLEKI
jgi:hypothetical protein